MAKKAVQPPKSRSSASKGQTTKAPSAEELEKAWNQSRTKAPPVGGKFEVADIPDGDYAVQLTLAAMKQYKSGNNKGTNYLSCRYTVVAGPYTGTELTSKDDVSLREVGTSGRTAMDLLSARLQKMGVDTKDIAFKKLPALAQALSDPKSEIGRPYLMVSVQTNRVPKKDDPSQENVYQNVYVNDPLTDADVAAIKKQLGSGK